MSDRQDENNEEETHAINHSNNIYATTGPCSQFETTVEISESQDIRI